jgi:hypothetical protein
MRRRKTSWLDQWVYRFQHRWETSPQYRAAVAGVCGLLLIVLMCSCTGLLALVTNSALAGASGGSNSSSDSGNANTGTKQLGGQETFPTSTIPPYTVAPIPTGNIPDSQTPGPTPTEPPTPTEVPTATPCQPNCGNGGGGGGNKGTISATHSPATWIAGQQGTLYIHTSNPNTGFSLIFNLHGVGTDLREPAGQTDGSGNATYVYNIPSGVTSGTGQVTLLGSDGSAGTAYIPCSP